MKLALIAIVVAALIAVSIAYCQPRPGEVAETWQTENSGLKIRIENRDEFCPSWCLPGAYYVFLSTRPESHRWREIMTFRHDDPGPIPRDNVRFVDEKIAFVFMGWMFAVTTDGGETWSRWSAQDDLPEWECCNYRLILTIAANGTGAMTLSTIPKRQGEVPELRTSDFGKHWSLRAAEPGLPQN